MLQFVKKFVSLYTESHAGYWSRQFGRSYYAQQIRFDGHTIAPAIYYRKMGDRFFLKLLRFQILIKQLLRIYGFSSINDSVNSTLIIILRFLTQTF